MLNIHESQQRNIRERKFNSSACTQNEQVQQKHEDSSFVPQDATPTALLICCGKAQRGAWLFIGAVLHPGRLYALPYLEFAKHDLLQKVEPRASLDFHFFPSLFLLWEGGTWFFRRTFHLTFSKMFHLLRISWEIRRETPLDSLFFRLRLVSFCLISSRDSLRTISLLQF